MHSGFFDVTCIKKKRKFYLYFKQDSNILVLIREYYRNYRFHSLTHKLESLNCEESPFYHA